MKGRNSTIGNRRERRGCARWLGGSSPLAMSVLSRAMLSGAILAAAQPAMADTVDGLSVNGTATFDGAQVSYSPGTLGDFVTINGQEAIIDWVPNGAVAGSEITFMAAGSDLTFNNDNFDDYTVLNRIIPGDTSLAARFDGSVSSFFQGEGAGGNIWFYSPGGITVGQTGTFDVGSLVLTSAAIDTTGGLYGTNNEIRFRGTAASGPVTIEGGAATANLFAGLPGSYIALVAPRINQGGIVEANGSVAYVAAEQADITINGGLFDIAITTGTDDPVGVSHTGTTRGPAGDAATGDVDHRQYLVAVPKNTALTMLVSGNLGYTSAALATEVDGVVVLSSGYDIANGDIVETGAVSGASMTIDGLNSSNNVVARAGDSLFLTDASGVGTVLGQGGDLGGALIVDIDYGAASTALSVATDLTVRAGTGATGGDLTLVADNGTGITVGGNLAISADGIGTKVLDPALPSNYLAGSVGADATGGSVMATFDNATLTVGNDLVVSAGAIAGQGELSAGTATAGSVDVRFLNGASLFGGQAGLSRFAADAVSGDYLSGTPLFSQTGSDSVAGSVTLIVDGASSFAGNDFEMSAIAEASVGLDGAARNATGGSLVFTLAGASTLDGRDFDAIVAAYAADDGVATSNTVDFTVDSGDFSPFGTLSILSYADGVAGTPVAMTASVLNGGSLTGGSLQIVSEAYGPGDIMGGQITVIDATDGVFSFGDAYIDNGPGATVPGGSIVIRSSADPILVSSFLSLYGSGTVDLLLSDNGGIQTNFLYSYVDGPLSISCVSASCTGAVSATGFAAIETVGDITVSGATLDLSSGYLRSDGSILFDPTAALISSGTVDLSARYDLTLSTVTVGDLFAEAGAEVIDDPQNESFFSLSHADGTLTFGNGGTATTADGISALSGGDIVIAANGSVLTQFAQDYSAGDDIIIGSGAQLLADLAGTGDGAIAISAGSIFSAESPVAGNVAAITGGIGAVIDANLSPVFLYGQAMDLRGSTIGGSSLIAGVDGILLPGDPQSDDFGRLSGCLEGDICLGGIGVTDEIQIGAEGTPVNFAADGNFSASIIGIYALGNIAYGNGAAPITMAGTGDVTIVAQQGDIALTNGATIAGSPLNLLAGGSLTGTGTLFSTGDLGLTVGDSITADALLAFGQLVGFGVVGAPAGTPYSVPGSISVASIFLSSDTFIDAGGAIALGDVNLDGNNLTLFTPGTVDVASITNVQDITISGGAIGIADLSTLGAISLTSDADLALGTVQAGGAVTLSSLSGTVAAADIQTTAPVNLFGASVIVGSSGALIVDSAFAYSGNVEISADGNLTVIYAQAAADILLNSGGGITAIDLFATGPSLISPAAVVLDQPGAGNISIQSALNTTIVNQAIANEQIGIDAGGDFALQGTLSARTIGVRSASISLAPGALLGSSATQAMTLLSTGDAVFGDGIGFAGYTIGSSQLSQIRTSGSLTLGADGTALIGDLTLTGGTDLGATGTLTITGGNDVAFLGTFLFANAASASMNVVAANDLVIFADTASLSMRSGTTNAGTLRLAATRVIAGSSTTLSDIDTLSLFDLTPTLGEVGLADGRSLIEGGFVTVDADGFYVVNTGAGIAFDQRRGFVANAMTITSSGDLPPELVINGIVNGRAGLFAANEIRFPRGYIPLSSVNGCLLGISGACGSIGDDDTQLTQLIDEKIIELLAEQAALDSEPRASIETSLVVIDKIEPAGFEPVIDEPVTGTGNDDLWQSGVADGEQPGGGDCKPDDTRRECMVEDAAE